MSRATIWLSTTAGFFVIACTPRIATCGWCRIGVASRPPCVPVLVTVKVPPWSSSSLSRCSRAAAASRSISRAIANRPSAPASRRIGTVRPSSVFVATPRWWWCLSTTSCVSSSSELLSSGNCASVAGNVRMTYARYVSLTPAASALGLSFARCSTSAVKSHSATNVNCAAVESERRMASAILRRRPRSGTRVESDSAAVVVAAAAFTSSALMRPFGPVPLTRSSATPSSLASARTAGVTSMRAPGAPGEAAAGWLTAAAAGAASAGAAATGAAAVPATAIVTMIVPTGTTCPSSAPNERIVPVRGEGISTLALSVITSTRGWSSLTASPAFTSQRTISPSATPSPMSGSFTS